MTEEKQREYVVSESDLDELIEELEYHRYNNAKVVETRIRANPYDPDALKAKVPSSKELILLAEHDWHNREERKRLHPMIPWTHGWITGFLTPNKPDWCKERETAIRKEERERVLNVLRDYIGAYRMSNRLISILERIQSLRKETSTKQDGG